MNFHSPLVKRFSYLDPITRKCWKFFPFPASIDEFIRTLSNIYNGDFLRKQIYKILNAPLSTCFLLQLPLVARVFFRHVKVLLKLLNQRKEKNEWKNKTMKTKSLSIMVCFSCLDTRKTYFLIWCLFICFVFFHFSVCTIIFL